MQLGCVSLRVAAAAGAAILLAAAIAGCGNHGAAAPLAAAGALRPASAASGCGHTEASGSLQYTLTLSGHRRTVIVHAPSGYTGSQKLPLVLNLHGSESTARAQEKFSGMDATSDADHFIVAYPQAAIPDGTGYDWNIPGQPMVNGKLPPASAPSDVAFLITLVRDLASRYCVDLSRVYATGVSGGGRMVSQLACDASSTFAAIAPVAGLRYPSPCPAARAVPVIAFHGTADPIDPFDGNGAPYWTYSVPAAAHLWAGHDHCATSPRTTSGHGYHLTRYTGCDGGSAVELYAITGEGHEWPGGPAMPSAITSVLGPQSDAVNANALMWAFFRANPLS
ncbi:MAG TPA: PHB depolymerase family esterase [Streptosporangiaceae bacterium]|nr:PHB depolymerase family esterase [Streptosporangiaceae bacterium]